MNNRLTRRQFMAGLTVSGATLLFTTPAFAKKNNGRGPDGQGPPGQRKHNKAPEDGSETEPEPDPPAPPEEEPAPSISLKPSGPIHVEWDGQVIEGLDIAAHGEQPAIFLHNRRNVTIRNCRIRHEYRHGIEAFGDFSGLMIENCDIECTGAPAAGPNPSSSMNNISLDGSTADPENVIVRRVRLARGSAGVYALHCPGILVEQVEGYDFRGPFPRGQVVQFNQCEFPVLQDFSVINNGRTSWSEDNVNAFICTEPVVRRGFIRGNNAPTGIGVLFEWGYGGLVEDVDCVLWSNGAFSAAGQQDDITFRHCRARDGIACEDSSWNVGTLAYDGSRIPCYEDWVGELDLDGPSSGSEAFMSWENGDGIRFEDCALWNLPRYGWWFHYSNGVEHVDIAEKEFTPREPIELVFGWEAPASDEQG